MNIGTHYNLSEFLLWTRRNIFWLFISSLVPTVLFHELQWRWIGIPWVPVALMGTAASFIAGFKNTQTYNRMWEARQIWGSIINSSRSWGIMVLNYLHCPNQPQVHHELIYRHIAWLTALRFQLRDVKPWENVHPKSYNRRYKKKYTVVEWETGISESLSPFLSQEECSTVLNKKNPATQIIALQSAELKSLKEKGHLDKLYFVEMQNILKELYEFQGKSERIKNFPYPRQFATINLFFIRILVHLLPLGMLREFDSIGPGCVWLTVPCSMIVGWVFTSLEQVGESTENPFEGGANDIPITSISRTIEIDLKEMLGVTDIPELIEKQGDIVM